MKVIIVLEDNQAGVDISLNKIAPVSDEPPKFSQASAIGDQVFKQIQAHLALHRHQVGLLA
jgi:hypothetical protein